MKGGDREGRKGKRKEGRHIGTKNLIINPRVAKPNNFKALLEFVIG